MGADTADWNSEAITDAVLNVVTHGAGTSFPTNWPIATRTFWRSDLERMYYNKGADTTPLVGDWEGAGCPTGTIVAYGGAEADVPSGWLLCDGQAVSRTTYNVLFDRVAEEYGNGDGSTTFNVPDMQTSNSMPRGATNDAGRGGSGGVATVTLTAAQSGLVSHGHTTQILALGGQGQAGSRAVQSSGQIGTGSTGGQSAASSHDNLPPFVDCHFIIAV